MTNWANLLHVQPLLSRSTRGNTWRYAPKIASRLIEIKRRPTDAPFSMYSRIFSCATLRRSDGEHSSMTKSGIAGGTFCATLALKPQGGSALPLGVPDEEGTVVLIAPDREVPSGIGIR